MEYAQGDGQTAAQEDQGRAHLEHHAGLRFKLTLLLPVLVPQFMNQVAIWGALPVTTASQGRQQAQLRQ